MDKTMNTSKEVCNALPGMVRIKSVTGELLSGNSKNETEVPLYNESNKMAVSGLEGKDISDFGKVSDNSKGVCTILPENLENESLLGESTSGGNEIEVTSCNESNESTVCGIEGNDLSDFGKVSSNSKEVCAIPPENLEHDSLLGESATGNLQSETEVTSCNESIKTAVSDFLHNAISDSEITSNNNEEVSTIPSKTVEIEAELEVLSIEGFKDKTQVISRNVNTEMAAFDLQGSTVAEFGISRNNVCQEVGTTCSEMVKIEPGSEESPNGTIRDELEVSSRYVNAEMNAFNFFGNAECEFEETSLLTFLGVKVEIEDMEESRLSQESTEFLCSSAISETQEARVTFENGYWSIKEEFNSDDHDTCFGGDLSLDLLDSERINSVPRNGPVIQSNIYYDSSSIKIRHATVKLEDLFPSSVRKQGKAHSNTGLCFCIYCHGEYRYNSDSQHRLKNRQNGKQLMHSKDSSKKLGKNLKYQQPSDSKIKQKVRRNKNISVNTLDKLEKDLKYRQLSGSKKVRKNKNPSVNVCDKLAEDLKHRQHSDLKICQKVQRNKNLSVKACGNLGNDLKYRRRSDSKVCQKVRKNKNLSVKAYDKLGKDLKYQRHIDSKICQKKERNKNPSVKASDKLGKYQKYPQSSNSKTCQKIGRNKKVFQCGKCSLKCEDRNALNSHLKTHGRGFKCKICAEKFLPRSALYAHLKVHDIDKPFKCQYCPFKFWFLSFLEAHLRVHSKEKPFKCKQCSARFSQNSSVKVHMRTHSDKRPIKCAQCPMTFKFRSNLTVHMRTHSGEKPFKCPQCPLEFLTSSNLKNHSRVHSGEKPFKCKVCLKRFQSSSGLSTHAKLHSGTKPYKCDQCPLRFAQSSTLYTHLRNIHSDAKPFECKLCPAKFKWNHVLVAHMRMHRGERPFKCEFCPGRFSQRTALKFHLRRHSSEDPLSCAYCSAKYKTKSNMIRHLKQCH